MGDNEAGEFLFDRVPWSGVLALLALAWLLYRRTRQALQVMETWPQRPLEVIEPPTPEPPSRNRVWDLTLCVLTGVVLSAGSIALFLLCWNPLALVFQGIGPIGMWLTLVVAFLLPSLARATWDENSEERGEAALVRLCTASYPILLWMLILIRSASVTTWPAVLALALAVPLLFACYHPAVRIHGLPTHDSRWILLFWAGAWLFLAGYGTTDFRERASAQGLLIHLHDGLGLLALVVAAWVSRLILVRAMERDGDQPNPERIPVFGLE